ncbi:zinc metalloprotease HtpX [Candidatus Kuenenbacteria bacterium HGW-Kuenenbacteria-1]|uniref:Protease HtpX homolog n=1 Tax=Candidatus Kuenenbacteria bacterium HGW-Kuenenbacteria-1 TaxID=2013812 RepID=A0A2N1UNR5_9BACT|nr:MAG: zinc metalloprotease HtpX [Candidatus Kuenenbacteria bacterium HGW-Kuenenbacteria-1]
MYDQITSNKQKSILIMTLFIIIILALGFVFGKITNYGYNGLIIAIIFSIAMSLFSYFQGDKVALWTAGAKPIEQKDNPYVYQMIENLCITAGLPLPKIYLIPDSAPNAFACGRNPKHASIALTTGIVEMLENEELEGVIAHELSHIRNYDILLMTITIVLVGIIMLLSDWLLHHFFWFGKGNRNDKNDQLGLILVVIGIILAILSPIIAELIKLAVSRKREFLADASGALLTRYPEGLASALEKISFYKQPLQKANHATAHLYFTNPFLEKKNFLSNLFSTHPPIEDRIKSLRKMI